MAGILLGGFRLAGGFIDRKSPDTGLRLDRTEPVITRYIVDSGADIPVPRSFALE